MRRWPGGATSATTAMPGRSCGAPITSRSASFSTAFMRWRRSFRPARSGRSRPTRSFWCNWPMRRSSNSTCCPGAGISAAFPGRAICRCSTSWMRWPPPAMPVRCRWKSSTTSFAPAPAPRTAIDGMRSLLLLQDQLASAAAGRLERCAAAKGAQPWRGLHRIRRQRDQGHSARRAVRPARLSQDRTCTAARPSSGGRRAVSNS